MFLDLAPFAATFAIGFLHLGNSVVRRNHKRGWFTYSNRDAIQTRLLAHNQSSRRTHFKIEWVTNYTNSEIDYNGHGAVNV